MQFGLQIRLLTDSCKLPVAADCLLLLLWLQKLRQKMELFYKKCLQPRAIVAVGGGCCSSRWSNCCCEYRSAATTAAIA